MMSKMKSISQVEEMLNKVSEYNKLSGKGHGDLKDNCYICGISPSGLIEAIDRLVTEARIDELKHIVSNSEWSDDDFYWYEVTREEYEGTKYYSEVRHLKRDQRIAELQSQLTNKEEK